MLCYVMLCYVMLCYVMLCYVMLCYKNSFLYKAGELWNALPPSVKESPDLDTFKQRYKALNSRSS